MDKIIDVYCQECYKIFMDKSELHKHKLLEHSDDNVIVKERFYCKYKGCNKYYDTKFGYQRHIKQHIRPYKCDYCDKSFATNMDKKYHEKIHLKLYDQLCVYCGKSFIHPQTLRKHINDKHNNINLYKCRICNKIFKRKYSLKMHYQTHLSFTNHIIKSYYICIKCDTSFVTKSNLNKHIKSIHGSSVIP